MSPLPADVAHWNGDRQSRTSPDPDPPMARTPERPRRGPSKLFLRRCKDFLPWLVAAAVQKKIASTPYSTIYATSHFPYVHAACRACFGRCLATRFIMVLAAERRAPGTRTPGSIFRSRFLLRSHYNRDVIRELHQLVAVAIASPFSTSHSGNFESMQSTVFVTSSATSSVVETP